MLEVTNAGPGRVVRCPICGASSRLEKPEDVPVPVEAESAEPVESPEDAGLPLWAIMLIVVGGSILLLVVCLANRPETISEYIDRKNREEERDSLERRSQLRREAAYRHIAETRLKAEIRARPDLEPDIKAAVRSIQREFDRLPLGEVEDIARIRYGYRGP
jgi:hypothetical protein